MAANVVPRFLLSGQHRLIEQTRSRPAPLPGAVLLIWLSSVALLDWWFPMETTSRVLPQTLRLILVIGLSLYCMSKTPVLMRARVVWFQFLWLVCMCVRFLSNGQLERDDAVYVGYYAFWIIVFWAAYCMAAKGQITTRQVAIVGTLMNAATCVYELLYIYMGQRPGQLNAIAIQDRIILGDSYVLLWFLLMQALASMRAYRAVVALSSIVVVIVGLERGAILSMLLGLFVYSAVQAHIRPSSKRRAIRWLIPTLLAVAASTYMTIGQMLARWNDLNNPEIAGSGRLRFWGELTNDWLNADVFTKIIGSGPRTVQQVLSHGVVFAHNDFLEQLHCFGLFGAVLYTAVCLALLRECYNVLKSRWVHAGVFCAATTVFISAGLYCIVSYSTSTVWFSMAAGVALGTRARARGKYEPIRFHLVATADSCQSSLLRSPNNCPSR